MSKVYFFKNLSNALVKSNLKIESFVLNISRHYAAKAQAKGVLRKYLTVENDVNKLCKSVCGANIYIDGKDPDIKEDSEYPDWLWNLRTEKTPLPLHELDKDSDEYWFRLKRMERKHQGKMRKVKLKFKRF